MRNLIILTFFLAGCVASNEKKNAGMNCEEFQYDKNEAKVQNYLNQVIAINVTHNLPHIVREVMPFIEAYELINLSCKQEQYDILALNFDMSSNMKKYLVKIINQNIVISDSCHCGDILNKIITDIENKIDQIKSENDIKETPKFKVRDDLSERNGIG